MGKDWIGEGGYNSEAARLAFTDRLAAFPGHPRHADRAELSAAIRAFGKEQEAAGWDALPASYRKSAVNGALHLVAGLPEAFRASVPWQAYYFLLDARGRRKARSCGNGIHLAWSPHSTMFC